jgi:predicted ATP-dependent Lon-type protease
VYIFVTMKKDPKLKRYGVSGYNKPKRTPNHPTKSHLVVAKEGGKVKVIRFGQQGVSGAGKSPKTEAQKARRRSFKARHAKNIAKGKMSAAYWADKVKW